MSFDTDAVIEIVLWVVAPPCNTFQAVSVVFAVLIGLVGAHRGFTVRGGPEAVGRATTSAVVSSIILCIVANAGFTALFYYAG